MLIFANRKGVETRGKQMESWKLTPTHCHQGIVGID